MEKERRKEFEVYLRRQGLRDTTVTTLLSLMQPYLSLSSLHEVVREWFKMVNTDVKALDLKAAGFKYLIAMRESLVVTTFLSPYGLRNRIVNKEETLSLYKELNSSALNVVVANGIPAKHLIPAFSISKTDIGIKVTVNRIYSSFPYLIPVFDETDSITKELYRNIEATIHISKLYFRKPIGKYKHVATAVTLLNSLS